MHICADQVARASDAELEKVYQALMAKTSLAGQPKLKLAKEAWTVYRTVQCEYNTLGTETGSVHPMVFLNCYSNLTDEYTELLRHQLACEEGDMSCGGQ